jgi:putative transposase
LLSLSDAINSLGAGTLPAGELPARLHTFTPPDEKAEHTARMAQAARVLAPLLKVNEQLKNFCIHPDSVVTLSVLPENEKYIFTKQYKIAHALRGAVSDIINRWKSTGKIELAPKNCPFNSPLLAVPKKDDQGKMTGVRLCTDVRVLNKYLIEDDRFQLPHIPDVLTAFGGGQFFGEFDLSEAYFQFRLSKESQKYTAFQWEGEQYMFVGCPFGLKHIPSFFQRFISNLFRDMPFVYPYIDNLGFASKTWDEHLMHAKMIIERLNSVNLRIKPASYNIGNTQIKLLGHVINRSGIGLDPEKRDMILNWPRPDDGAGLASALGLGAYLRDHVRHYADIAAPLEKVKRQKTINWTSELNQSWEFPRDFQVYIWYIVSTF